MEALTLLLALAPFASAATIRRQADGAVPGQWIATLKSDVVVADVLSTVHATLARRSEADASPLTDFEPIHEYSLAGFKGFAFKGDDALLDALLEVDTIDTIEPDTYMYASAPIAAGSAAQAALVSQPGAPWGLGRISNRAKGSDTYYYDSSAGEGSYAYVIDTGINAAHQEFEGRAVQAKSFVLLEPNTDLQGHGTHCAGTIGAKTYGVAKNINLIGVKVLNILGMGFTSDIIKGVEWSVDDATTNGRISTSVISMSLGGGYSAAMNSAVAAAIRSGIFVAVAAGNDNKDAAAYSPASERTACTIGATDINDRRANFSNFGDVVDVFAPGVNVTSTWVGGSTATRTISGTSMACPHVAGLAAYLLVLEGAKGPEELCSYIAAISSEGLISNVPAGTKNLLAYNLSGR